MRMATISQTLCSLRKIADEFLFSLSHSSVKVRCSLLGMPS